MNALSRCTLAGALVISALAAPTAARAHCDTLDGPVVADARKALEAGEIAPVLKWIRSTDEPELRAAFRSVSRVRELGPQARELADRSFFETLVRLHRAGEGAPFTGLRPAGTAVEPIVLAADRALASGSDAELVEHLTATIAAGTHQRFAAALAARADAERTAETGRHYVAAYVELTHWLERIEHDASSNAAHRPADEADVHEGH